jgi:hypothetical protein
MSDVYASVYGKAAPRLAGMQAWPDAWLSNNNPMGWLQWYQKYSNGESHDAEENASHIRRWRAFKSRHGAAFQKNPTARHAFAMRNWAIDATKLLDDPVQRKHLRNEMREYKDMMDKKWQVEKNGGPNVG